jgi:phytoene desaturase
VERPRVQPEARLSRSAVIVGGGLGGLAAGLRLRAAGWRVSICEAGPRMGGKMNRWSSGGFTFDTGPSLITMPWVFADLFAAAGSRLEEHLDLIPLSPLAHYIYADGVNFTYSSSLPDWFKTLARIAPEDKQGFLKFLELGARLWEVSRRTFMSRSPYDPPGKGDWEVLRHMPVRYGWGNYNATVRAHFKSPYLRQLFNRYPTYVGSSPHLSPATLAVIPYLEFAFGGWYVRGGLYGIVESVVSLACRNGVEMRTNSRVARIERAGGRVTGVVLDSGEQIPAGIVVMNGDAAMVPELLGEAAAPATSRSMSGFVMLLGIRRQLPQLQPHTIFFSDDYEREFDEICDRRQFPTDPTVYVNAPSRVDRSIVPEDGESLFIMANAPARSDQWSQAEIRQARDRVFARLQRSGFPDISNDIAVEDIWTPRRIEETYLMPGGAIYGTDSHGWRNAFLRPRNKNQSTHGLYHVGGSTHPGGGTPTVLLSAEITCKLIQRHEGS